MVIECLEICLHLSNKERYIEIKYIIIPNIVENYNKYLPFTVNMFTVNMDSEKIRKL